MAWSTCSSWFSLSRTQSIYAGYSACYISRYSMTVASTYWDVRCENTETRLHREFEASPTLIVRLSQAIRTNTHIVNITVPTQPFLSPLSHWFTSSMHTALALCVLTAPFSVVEASRKHSFLCFAHGYIPSVQPFSPVLKERVVFPME